MRTRRARCCSAVWAAAAAAAWSRQSLGACPSSKFEFVGNQRQFTVFQDCVFSITAPAVERLVTAKDFYDYRSASSHTGFEKTDRSFLFLYRNLEVPGELAIFWLHGMDDPDAKAAGLPLQQTACVWGQMTGIPTGANIAQADDGPSEFDWSTKLGWDHSTPTHSGEYINGRWWFAHNTDGGSLDKLNMDIDWEIKVEVNFDDPRMKADCRGKMNDWRFFFADGSDQVLDTSRPLYIRSEKPDDSSGIVEWPGMGATATFCGLAVDANGGNLKYTFAWEDGQGTSEVTKPQGQLACREHTFCMPEFGCGGMYPRKVTVTVENECGEKITKTLALEGASKTKRTVSPSTADRACPSPPSPPSPPPRPPAPPSPPPRPPPCPPPLPPPPSPPPPPPCPPPLPPPPIPPPPPLPPPPPPRPPCPPGGCPTPAPTPAPPPPSPPPPRPPPPPLPPPPCPPPQPPPPPVPPPPPLPPPTPAPTPYAVGLVIFAERGNTYDPATGKIDRSGGDGRQRGAIVADNGDGTYKVAWSNGATGTWDPRASEITARGQQVPAWVLHAGTPAPTPPPAPVVPPGVATPQPVFTPVPRTPSPPRQTPVPDTPAPPQDPKATPVPPTPSPAGQTPVPATPAPPAKGAAGEEEPQKKDAAGTLLTLALVVLGVLLCLCIAAAVGLYFYFKRGKAAFGGKKKRKREDPEESELTASAVNLSAFDIDKAKTGYKAHGSPGSAVPQRQVSTAGKGLGLGPPSSGAPSLLGPGAGSAQPAAPAQPADDEACE